MKYIINDDDFEKWIEVLTELRGEINKNLHLEYVLFEMSAYLKRKPNEINHINS